MHSLPSTRKMGAMGKQGVAAVLAGSALVLAGCGSVMPADVDPTAGATRPATTGQAPGGEGLSSGPRPLGATSQTPPLEPSFPLTVRRTGGAGGFDDTVVLLPDGTVQVDTRSLHHRVCTLASTARADLVRGLRTITLPIVPVTGRTEQPTERSTGSTSSGAPIDPSGEATDQILITVTDVHDRLVDLTDPSLGKISGMVNALVQDVTLTTPLTATCTTPATR